MGGSFGINDTQHFCIFIPNKHSAFHMTQNTLGMSLWPQHQPKSSAMVRRMQGDMKGERIVPCLQKQQMSTIFVMIYGQPL